MKLGSMDCVLAAQVPDAFKRAARLGLQGVEVNLSIKPLLAGDRSQIETARRASVETGVQVVSAVLGEHNHGGLATWWRGSEAEEELQHAIRATAAMGASDLLVPFFFFNEPKGRVHRAAVARRIRPLCELAADQGVRFCFEGVLTADQLLELIGLVDHDRFGVYYDPANATWCDYDIAAEARRLGRHLLRTHLKEAATFTGDARLGQGRVNHAAYAAALKDIGYTGWFVLETPAGDDAEVTADIAFARRAYGAVA